MSIILIRGYSNSGKDFVGRILCEKYGYQRFAFADSLKSIVATQIGCDVSLLHSQTGKAQICETDSQKRTWRQILLDKARHLRNTDPDTFVNHLCQQIQNLSECSPKIVITDWRYPNECSVLQTRFPDFVVIPLHIIRSGQLESPVDDISENLLCDRTEDYTIVNQMNNTIFTEVENFMFYKNTVTK